MITATACKSVNRFSALKVHPCTLKHTRTHPYTFKHTRTHTCTLKHTRTHPCTLKHTLTREHALTLTYGNTHERTQAGTKTHMRAHVRAHTKQKHTSCHCTRNQDWKKTPDVIIKSCPKWKETKVTGFHAPRSNDPGACLYVRLSQN